MRAPLVVFVYNRPVHTKRTLEKINMSSLANETDIYIYCDFAKKEENIKMVLKTREVVKEFTENSNFKTTNIIFAESNKGLANSIVEGVTVVIEQYGSVIVLEDDLIVSDDFLEYMNAGLEYYENCDNIWSLSGYSFPIDAFKTDEKDYYLSYRGCSWGWATWKDRWKSVDWNVKKYKSFKFNFFERKRFNRGGSDLSAMLDLQMTKRIDSWAIRWCFEQFQQNKFTVYPKKSRVMNIGTDGSGTHSPITNKFDSFLFTGTEKFDFENLNLNPEILDEFKRKYSLTIKERIKLEIYSVFLRISFLRKFLKKI